MLIKKGVHCIDKRLFISNVNLFRIQNKIKVIKQILTYVNKIDIVSYITISFLILKIDKIP